MSTLLKFTLSAVVIYATIVLVAWLAQRRLMYFPNPSHITPSQAGLTDFDEIRMRAPDGAGLTVWSSKARAGQPTLLYFHGNGGGLVNRAGRFARYQAAGLGVFAMSYRGYSGSTGTPSEAANLSDAVLAYDTLRAQGIAANDIFLYGESLGSGIAVATAVRKQVAGVILDAPYTSVVEVAARQYPVLPVRTLLTDRYESDKLISEVKAPVLVLHGTKDRVIPVEMGRKLFELAHEPKKLVIFPEGGHVDLDDHGAVQAVVRWVERVRAER
jgi:hypothetical protein